MKKFACRGAVGSLFTALLLSTVAVPAVAAAGSGSVSPSVEPLCGPAAPGYARCFALLRTDIFNTGMDVSFKSSRLWAGGPEECLRLAWG